MLYARGVCSLMTDRLLTIYIETHLGYWERRDVSPTERRKLLQDSDIMHRFVRDGISYITHQLNDLPRLPDIGDID